MTDRSTAQRVLAALKGSPVGDGAVLVGSSGLFGFDTRVPALTEDIDVVVDVGVVEREGPALVVALAALGFMHEHGTASFAADDGTTFDLLGLTPAGFAASKLLTERAHKGSKDKIQALLVMAERAGDHG